jgi:ABC-type glutathione transport system ATPase component
LASYSRKETNLVLNDINLKIRRGRTVALVGESGSGKSTLARVITGLLPPLKGRVSYEGSVLPPALKNRTREMLRQVQMIYQMPRYSTKSPTPGQNDLGAFTFILLWHAKQRKKQAGLRTTEAN